MQARAMDHFYLSPGDQNNIFAATSFIDDCTFYLTMWLFGALILETALDIERMMLQDSDTSEGGSKIKSLKRTKKLFKVANIFVPILIVLINIPLLAAVLQSNLSIQTRQTCSTIGEVGQSTIVLTSTVFMIITHCKLHVIA